MCWLRLSLCAAFAALLTGCSGNVTPIGPLIPNAESQSPTLHCNRFNPMQGLCSTSHIAATTAQRKRIDSPSDGYIYVANRTKQGTSQLLVFTAGTRSPALIRTVTQGLVDVGGLAVDSAGNVYLANGRGGNVIEYSPGATALVRTYSLGLIHPVAVTVTNNTVYVDDQGSNGYGEQVLEYAVGQTQPLMGVGGIGSGSQLNEGIAINPVERGEPFYASASSLTGVPPVGCRGTYVAAENILPTLWEVLPLTNNQQAWGIAFDSKGRLYASDPCENRVVIYAKLHYTWIYAGVVPGTFSAPMFLTIDNDMLAIPSSKGATGDDGSGYVTVADLSGNLATITLTNGIEHPVAAAAAFGSAGAPEPRRAQL